jgi:hypothetical protein
VNCSAEKRDYQIKMKALDASRFIKETVSRDFRLLVFHKTTSLRPLIHRLKPFCICLEFAKIFDFEIADFGLSGVNHTAEAKDDP